MPFNHEILREACALCHCLPVLSTDKFKTDFYDVSGGHWGLGGAQKGPGGHKRWWWWHPRGLGGPIRSW